jgi:hypothetical protein
MDCFVVPPRNDAMRVWEQSPETDCRFAPDCRFASLRGTKQSRDEVKSIVDMLCFQVKIG